MYDENVKIEKNVGMSWETVCDNLFIEVPCLRIFSLDERYHFGSVSSPLCV